MKGRWLLGPLFLGMIWVLPARAVMIRYNLEQLSTGAEKIVVGRVVDMESRYLVPGQEINTFVTIAVDEVLKGEAVGNEVIVRVLGGSVGDEEMVASHAPSFMIAEEVLVFVARQVDGQDEVYNAENGKYTIEGGIVVEENVPLENFVLAIRAYLGGSRLPR